MLSIFKQFFDNKPKTTDAGPTALPNVFNPSANLARMQFEERKQWRLEMVHLSIRETFNSLEVLGSMYRHNLAKIDDRGHQYNVMIEISKTFDACKRNDIKSFLDIETLIRKNTFEKYGVVIRGIYWRSNEYAVFDRLLSKEIIRKKTKADLHRELDGKDFLDTLPADTRNAPRPVFEPVSSHEAEEFRAALRAGIKPPTIHVGNKEYSTDVAPLGLE
jgi:hypothetical protein